MWDAIKQPVALDVTDKYREIPDRDGIVEALVSVNSVTVDESGKTAANSSCSV